MKSPLLQVKERFGDKEKLINELSGLLERGEDESKDDVKARLRGVSNIKLLRLRERADRLAEYGGSRDKVIAELVKHAGREKDAGYRSYLDTHTTGRLLDMLDHAVKLANRAKLAQDKTGKADKGRTQAAPRAAKAASAKSGGATSAKSATARKGAAKASSKKGGSKSRSAQA